MNQHANCSCKKCLFWGFGHCIWLNFPFLILIYLYCCRYAANRSDDERDGDVWDGTVLKDEPKATRRVVIYLSGCNDAAVFQSYRQLSFSPWVFECLNFPPHQRHSFSGLFFLALLPPSVCWPLICRNSNIAFVCTFCLYIVSLLMTLYLYYWHCVFTNDIVPLLLTLCLYYWHFIFTIDIVSSLCLLSLSLSCLSLCLPLELSVSHPIVHLIPYILYAYRWKIITSSMVQFFGISGTKAVLKGDPVFPW